jgi:hypothetical protein
MRHPIVTGFVIMSFIGIGCFAAACAKSDEADPGGVVLTNTNPTDPADGGKTKKAKLPPKSDPTPAPTATNSAAPDASPPPADAGVDARAGDDDDDNTGGTECDPNNNYYTAQLAAIVLAGGTPAPCPNGGSDCSANECCLANPIMPQANVCLLK